MERLDLKGHRPGRGVGGEGTGKAEPRMQGQGLAHVLCSARHRNCLSQVSETDWPGCGPAFGGISGSSKSLIRETLLDKKALPEPLRHLCLQLPRCCLQRFLSRDAPRAHSLLQSCDSWHFYLLKPQFPHPSKGEIILNLRI